MSSLAVSNGSLGISCIALHQRFYNFDAEILPTRGKTMRVGLLGLLGLLSLLSLCIFDTVRQQLQGCFRVAPPGTEWHQLCQL